MKNKMPYDKILPIAMAIVELIRPHCERIELAGSLRRKKDEIGDIEIVASPKSYVLDLLGEPTETHSIDTIDWSPLGKVYLNGHKQKKLIIPGDISIDLFIVTPPAQWGVIYMLRTGSQNFMHRFVTPKSFGGSMPGHLRMKEGAIWHGSKLMETPEEPAVFKLFGARYVPPAERE